MTSLTRHSGAGKRRAVKALTGHSTVAAAGRRDGQAVPRVCVTPTPAHPLSHMPKYGAYRELLKLGSEVAS